MTRFTYTRRAKTKKVTDTICINDRYDFASKDFTRRQFYRFFDDKTAAIVILDGENLLLAKKLRSLGWTGPIIVVESNFKTHITQHGVKADSKLDVTLVFDTLQNHFEKNRGCYKYAVMDFTCTVETAAPTIQEYTTYAPKDSRIVIVFSPRSRKSTIERSLDYLRDNLTRETSVEGILRYCNVCPMTCAFMQLDQDYHENWQDVKIKNINDTIELTDIYTRQKLIPY